MKIKKIKFCKVLTLLLVVVLSLLLLPQNVSAYDPLFVEEETHTGVITNKDLEVENSVDIDVDTTGNSMNFTLDTFGLVYVDIVVGLHVKWIVGDLLWFPDYEYYYNNSVTYAEAYNDGFLAGTTDGQTSGYIEGYSAGDSAGYTRGYNEGVIAGDIVGYDRGHAEAIGAFTTGYEVGYDEGYMAQYPYAIHKVSDTLIDVLDVPNKKFYDNVGGVQFNGSEVFNARFSTSEYIGFSHSVPNIGTLPNYPNATQISNLFPFLPSDTYNVTKEGFYIIETVGLNSTFMFSVLKTRLIGYLDTMTPTEKINLFKTWLSTNNLIINYKLATPTITILTNTDLSQIPSFQSGYDNGDADGYIRGYDNGRIIGNGEGYSQAVLDVNAFTTFLPNVFGAVWLIFTDFLSLEIFGISVWGVLLSLALVALAILIIKMVL